MCSSAPDRLPISALPTASLLPFKTFVPLSSAHFVLDDYCFQGRKHSGVPSPLATGLLAAAAAAAEAAGDAAAEFSGWGRVVQLFDCTWGS